jgi:hypothetical protein
MTTDDRYSGCMTQPWTASKLAEERIADIRRLATTPRRTAASGPREDPGLVALVTARILVAAGWRLGGTGALPASLRRRVV